MDGGAGNDLIGGGLGDDRIIGSAGNGNLFGNGGDDRFIFASGWGHDLVNDFENGREVLDVTGVAGVDAFSDLTVTYSGGSTYIAFGPDDIRLYNIDSSLIDASEFVFA